jgi:hypothetical protein
VIVVREVFVVDGRTVMVVEELVTADPADVEGVIGSVVESCVAVVGDGLHAASATSHTHTANRNRSRSRALAPLPIPWGS